MPLASTKHGTLHDRAVLRRPKNTASEAEQRAEAPACDSASLRKTCTMPSSDSSSSSEDRKRKKKKHKKEHKHKKHKKEKKSKKDKKRRRDDDDDDPVVAANVPTEKLDAEDDYYARAAEFRTWLRDAKDLYLDDLAADEARKLFAQFVDRWNAGRLDASYYSGEAAGRGGKRTRHAWSFKLSDTEARGLASTRAAVSRQSAQDDPTLIRQFDKQPAVVAKPCRPQVKPRDDGAELRRLKVPPRPPGE